MASNSQPSGSLIRVVNKGHTFLTMLNLAIFVIISFASSVYG